MKRLPATHLIVIIAALGALAAGAWYYTTANDPVEGIPAAVPVLPDNGPSTSDACEKAGGVWNECASACPPDAEACIMMCVQKCEGINDGKKVVNVYFPNSKLDPKHLDCSKVFPVKRAVISDTLAQSAVETLLRGPTDAEKGAGAFSTLPEDTELNSIVIKGNVAHVDFSSALAAVAGSCRVGAIRAQIEKTLLGIPGVKSVVISVNGDSEGALQP